MTMICPYTAAFVRIHAVVMIRGSEVLAQFVCGSPELFQVIEELLFYGFHAVMRSPVYALCNTHRLLDTGADLLVDRNVFLRFQSHSEAVGNDSIKVCGRVLFAGDANA